MFGCELRGDDKDRFARPQHGLLLLVAHQVEHTRTFDRQCSLLLAPGHRDRAGAFGEQVYRQTVPLRVCRAGVAPSSCCSSAL